MTETSVLIIAAEIRSGQERISEKQADETAEQILQSRGRKMQHYRDID